MRLGTAITDLFGCREIQFKHREIGILAVIHGSAFTCTRENSVRGRFEIRCQTRSSSNNAFASFRSRVSNPSVNQP